MSEGWKSGESAFMDSQTESLKRIANTLERMLLQNQPADVKSVRITNGDKIRAMTDDELEKFICSKSTCSRCGHASASGCDLLDWLGQEAEE